MAAASGTVGDVPCPSNPPPPAGTVIWTLPVSKNLENWAIGVLNNPTDFPMLSLAYAVVDGQPVVARVEHHTWIGKTGQKGVCIRGVTLYHPTAVPFIPDTVGARTYQPAVPVAAMYGSPASVAAAAPAAAMNGPKLIEIVSFAIVAFTSAYGISAAIFKREREHGESPHFF